MLRRTLVMVTAVTFMFAVGACSDSDSGSIKEFCDFESSAGDPEKPQEMAKAFTELKERAPDEIKGDIDVAAKAFAEYSENVEGLDETEDLEEMAKASEVMQTPEVQKAVENVTAFEEKNCTND